MFGINDKTEIPEFTKLPNIPKDSDVTVLLTVAKDTDGHKGKYAIFEGKISEVRKGPLAVGQEVKVKMVQLDDQRRIIKNKDGSLTNYAIIEVVKFLEKVNGEPFPKESLNAAVAAMCQNIEGMAVKAVTFGKPGENGKEFTETEFITVANQDIGKQRELLKSL